MTDSGNEDQSHSSDDGDDDDDDSKTMSAALKHRLAKVQFACLNLH